MNYKMTDLEIRARYRTLHPKLDRLQILADLNAVDRAYIARIVGTSTKRDKRVHITEKRDDSATILEMYNRGMTDKEIGDRINKHLSTVYQWRKTRGLPSNRSRLGGKAWQ